MSYRNVMFRWNTIGRMTFNPSHHRDVALDCLAGVHAYSDSLREEWAKDRPNSSDARYLNSSISRGLKLAEIHALLHTGAQLERIANALDREQPLEGAAFTDAGAAYLAGGDPRD